MSDSSKKTVETTGNPMWGGGYDRAPDTLMTKINASIGVDKRLYKEDITGSIAHATMLAQQGIITEADREAIVKGLHTIQEEIESGRFAFTDALEDIHMHVESRLAELIGDAAGRLHTARSRNDQVATDFKLWTRSALEFMEQALQKLQATLCKRVEEHSGSVMPGFTHLQTAQPVTLGHHLLAYVEMFGRDRLRIQDAIAHLNECPLGAAALAGTSFPLDRQMTAKALGFDRPAANSMDAVASRDFALELLSCAAISMTHMSRLAEEIILWTSSQFGFAKLSDAFSTGSSIMPQKRNPDAAELIRAKTARCTGNLVALLTTMKALPLAYNKDLQEDKDPVFDTVDSFMLCSAALAGMMSDMVFNTEKMQQAAGQNFATATDLADWLVQKLSIPFRQAHHITGKIVALAARNDTTLEQLTLEELQSVEPRISKEVFNVLSVTASVNSRTSFGGTSPANVKQAVKAAKERWL